MINAKGVTKAFDQRTLWSDLSFSIRAGEIVAIVGPSGCGKSTLLNCLGLLESVDTGEVTIAGRDITKLGARAQRQFRRDTLGYLFQNYALVENATAEFNLGIAQHGEASGRKKREAALAEVGLDGRGKEMVFRLSGGEQQRLALARLLVKKPTIILADEPTGALDNDNADIVISILRRMAEGGCVVVIATHSKQVEGICDATLDLGFTTLRGCLTPSEGLTYRQPVGYKTHEE